MASKVIVEKDFLIEIHRKAYLSGLEDAAKVLAAMIEKAKEQTNEPRD
jgi:hypothetical protein